MHRGNPGLVNGRERGGAGGVVYPIPWFGIDDDAGTDERHVASRGGVGEGARHPGQRHRRGFYILMRWGYVGTGNGGGGGGPEGSAFLQPL